MTGKQRAVKRQLFPEKLWDLVNKPSSGIQWSPDGTCIQVERAQLEKFIGTKFRSHNFDSFIRQLHFYGFRKCGNSYHHDKFQRGRPEALLTMKRKYSNLALPALCRTPVLPYCASPTINSVSSTSSSNSSTSSASSRSSSAEGSSSHSVTSNTGSTNDHAGDATSSVVEAAIDLSQVGDISNGALKTAPLIEQVVGYPIDYSNPCNRQISVVDKKTKTIQSTRKTDKITMYLLNSGQDHKKTPTYTSVSQDLATVNRDEKSIKITLPDVMKSLEDCARPRTLVLENFCNGNESILSAYFIYKTN